MLYYNIPYHTISYYTLLGAPGEATWHACGRRAQQRQCFVTWGSPLWFGHLNSALGAF